MRHAILVASALSLVGSFAPSADAQTTVSEPPDFSNTIPGEEVELGAGTTTVSGTVTTPDDGQDNFQVTVPTGAELTGISLTLDTSGGFMGFVTWNLSETLEESGEFTSGLPAGPGTYQLQVVGNFAPGNAWSLAFTVEGAEPECGNGLEEAGEECDDGNTTECDGCSSSCEVVLDGCSIDGACVAPGTLDPDNECRSCQPEVSRTDYSPVSEGTECDDGQFCTDGDTCNGLGSCTGAPRDCGDGLSCTTDACDEAGDTCVNPLSTGCLIDGSCVEAGATDPANECQACDPDTSTSSYSPVAEGTPCDDGTDAGLADGGANDGGSDAGDADVPADAAFGDAGGDPAAGGSSGGCHIAARPTGSHAPLLLAALAVLGIALRRRRRH